MPVERSSGLTTSAAGDDASPRHSVRAASYHSRAQVAGSGGADDTGIVATSGGGRRPAGSAIRPMLPSAGSTRFITSPWRAAQSRSVWAAHRAFRVGRLPNVLAYPATTAAVGVATAAGYRGEVAYRVKATHVESARSGDMPCEWRSEWECKADRTPSADGLGYRRHQSLATDGGDSPKRSLHQQVAVTADSSRLLQRNVGRQ